LAGLVTVTPAPSLPAATGAATPPTIPEVPGASPLIAGVGTGVGTGQLPVDGALALAGLITVLALVVFLSADRLIGPRRRVNGR
jgi:hypothetical protein